MITIKTVSPIPELLNIQKSIQNQLSLFYYLYIIEDEETGIDYQDVKLLNDTYGVLSYQFNDNWRC